MREVLPEEVTLDWRTEGRIALPDVSGRVGGWGGQGTKNGESETSMVVNWLSGIEERPVGKQRTDWVSASGGTPSLYRRGTHLFPSSLSHLRLLTTRRVRQYYHHILCVRKPTLT